MKDLKKQALAILMAITLTLSTTATTISVYAQETNEVTQTENKATDDTNEKVQEVTKPVIDEQTTEVTEAPVEEDLSNKTATVSKTIIGSTGNDNTNISRQAEEVEINATNFPDENFREYIKTNFDKSGDNILSQDEIANILTIHIGDRTDINSIKGIEFFTSLNRLFCYNTGITELDVSKNSKLGTLNCGDTSIQKLDLKNNLKLQNIQCYNTKIVELDVSNNPQLTMIGCQGTEITSLDVSNNPLLGDLKCQNTKITGLDVSKNLKLENLYCQNTPLAYLNLHDKEHADISWYDYDHTSTLTIDNGTSDNFNIKEKFPGIDISKITITSSGITLSPDGVISGYTEENPQVVYEYNCGYLYGSSTPETITVTLNLMVNHAPKITAQDKTFTVGDTFNDEIALKDVTASDKEDGDLTDEIEVIDNTVDTSKADTYTVTYKVTDSQGASCTKTIYVTVNPKMEILNEVPTISAKDKTLTVGDSFDPKKDVTASDKEDGDLTDEIEVIDNTVDTSKADTYTVTYKVTDSQGASCTKTIYVTVNPKMEILNEVPTISAKDKTLTVGDSFDPKKDVTASDKEDGDLTDKIEVIDNTVDTSKADTYTVTYKVTDKDGASTTKTITVTVKEKDKEEQPTTPTKPDKGDNNSNDKNNTVSKTDKTVKTGDSTNIFLWSMVTAISLAGVITVLLFKRRRNR